MGLLLVRVAHDVTPSPLSQELLHELKRIAQGSKTNQLPGRTMSRRPPVCTVLQCSACARSSGTIQTVVRAPIPTQSITLSKGFSLLRSQGIHASIQRQLATAWRGPLQLPWQTVEAGRPAPTRRAAADLRAKTPLKQHSGPLSNVGQFRPAPLPISIPVTGGGFDDNVDRLGTVNGSMYLFHVI